MPLTYYPWAYLACHGRLFSAVSAGVGGVEREGNAREIENTLAC
jgi:hypothetical protein